MSTKSSTLDHDAGYTTDEIQRYHDQQDRSARRRRWLRGARAAVVIAGGAAAAALMFTSSGTTPAVPAAPGPPRPSTRPCRAAPPRRPSTRPSRPVRPGHRYLGGLMTRASARHRDTPRITAMAMRGVCASPSPGKRRRVLPDTTRGPLPGWST